MAVKDRVIVKYCDCGGDASYAWNTWNLNKNNSDYKFRCPECYHKFRSNVSKNIRKNMTQEERDAAIAKQVASRVNKSEEEKAKTREKTQNTWKSKPKEEMDAYRDHCREHALATWANYTEDEYNEMCKKFSAAQQAYNNMTPEEKVISTKLRSEASKKGWKSLKSNEKRYQKYLQNASENSKRMWAGRSIEECLSVREKISAARKAYWANISDEDKDKWSLNQSNRFFNQSDIIDNPSEIKFKNIMNINGVNYETQYGSKIKHPEFDKLFPINPVTKSNIVSPYHRWDFIIHADEKDILIDIDGSMHDMKEDDFVTNNRNNSKLTEFIDIKALNDFNDSKRPYQTDGMKAYIIKCYDDNLTLDTPVVDVEGKNPMTVRTLLPLLKTYDKKLTEKFVKLGLTTFYEK